MHIITPSARKARGIRGFTLVELIVSATMSGIVLVGVFASVIMIAHSGYRLSHYIEMENEARTALETIAVDARVTKTIAWHRPSETAALTGITLTAPDGLSVRYDYDSANQRLRRTAPDGSVRNLITGVQSLTFTAYQYADAPGIELVNPATTSTADLNDLTKMLQISLSSVRSRSSLADATNNVVSARYVLRNKIQSN